MTEKDAVKCARVRDRDALGAARRCGDPDPGDFGELVLAQVETSGTETMDPRLLDILVCPLCKGPLVYRKAQSELVCKPAASATRSGTTSR